MNYESVNLSYVLAWAILLSPFYMAALVFIWAVIKWTLAWSQPWKKPPKRIYKSPPPQSPIDPGEFKPMRGHEAQGKKKI